MKYFALLLLLFTTLNSAAQLSEEEITSDRITCLIDAESEYFLYTGKNLPISIYLKTDHCGLVDSAKSVSKLNLTGNAYININSSFWQLPLTEYYNSMLFKRIFYNKENPKIIVVEMYLFSFINSDMYNYLIIDYSDMKLCYAETDNKGPLKSIKAIFNNYKRGEYNINTIDKPLYSSDE